MSISQYSSSLAFYISLGYLLKFKYNKKLASNYISFAHASGAVMLATMYKLYQTEKLYHCLKLWSSGYFIADSLSMIKTEKFNILNLAYLYHHISATYFLHQDPSQYMNMDVMLWGELSNLPSYFVYHYLHNKIKYPQSLHFWTNIQKYVYASIRVPVISLLAIKMWNKAPNKKPVLIVSPVYLMGLIWTMKILRKNSAIEK
jgi:hypothetical protein